MIIDIHAHLAYEKLYPKSYFGGMLHGLEKGIPGIEKSRIIQLTRLFLRDKDCAQLINQMNDAGIQKSVLLIIDGGIGMEEAELTIEEIFECNYHVLKKYPERFIVFGGIDPRRGKEGYELFKKGIVDYGFRGLKLYPPMGFAMNDERLDPYYLLCAEYRIPILIHTGPSLPYLQNEFADPKYIYQVAKKYPDVNFILAHAGFSLSSPSVELVIFLPNVYVDIAGFQTKFKKNDQLMIEKLGAIFDNKYNRKVLFGSDWPLFNLITPLSYHVNIIKELYQKIYNEETGVPLENIFHKNALQVLNIS